MQYTNGNMRFNASSDDYALHDLIDWIPAAFTYWAASLRIARIWHPSHDAIWARFLVFMLAIWVTALRPAGLLISFYPCAAGALHVAEARLWRRYRLYSPAGRCVQVLVSGLLCQAILLGIGATPHPLPHPPWATAAMMPAGSRSAKITHDKWYARAWPFAILAGIPIKANLP